MLEILVYAAAVAARIGAKLEILHNSEIGENPSALGHVGNPQSSYLVRPRVRDVPASEVDAASAGFYQARYGGKGCGFAGAIRAYHGDKFPFMHNYREVLDSSYAAVSYFDL